MLLREVSTYEANAETLIPALLLFMDRSGMTIHDR
jgi:hypothetical protein